MNDRGRVRPVSLYLHFPFCVRKCRYCDFLSGPASDERREEYTGLLCREISLRADGLFLSDQDQNESGYIVDTIFIGGGTPSLPDAMLIADTLDVIRSRFDLAPDAEITLECNPGTLNDKKLHIYHSAGINRLSIGLQSADNSLLKLLGRIHDFETFRKEYTAARTAGFQNISVTVKSNTSIIERLSTSSIVANADLTQIIDFNSDPVMVPVTVQIPGVSTDSITAIKCPQRT